MSHLCGVNESEKLHAIAKVRSLYPPSPAWLIISQITNPLIWRKSHPHMPAPHYFINMSFLFNTSLSLFALFTLKSRHLAKKRWKKKIGRMFLSSLKSCSCVNNFCYISEIKEKTTVTSTQTLQGAWLAELTTSPAPSLAVTANPDPLGPAQFNRNVFAGLTVQD